MSAHQGESMSENIKDQTAHPEKERPVLEKVPLTLYFQWPLIQLNRTLGDVVNAYKKLFKIGPTDLKSMYLKKFEAANQRGETWKCIRWMEKVASIDPDDPNTFYLLGVSYEMDGRMEESLNAYARVIEIKPDHAKALYRLGLLYLRKRDFEAALEPLQKALEIEPRSAELNFRLGLAYDRMQDHEKAISFFSKAVEINDKFLKAYKNMALTFDSLGKHKEALDCLKRALEIEEMSS